MDALKAWRRETATANQVPAYVVFSDATLEEIIQRQPSTPRELGRVKGVGPKKLELYAEEVLELVAGHVVSS